MIVNIICGDHMIEIISRESSATAVIGAQWGDEGKGKVVDEETENSDYLVRSSGGDNAGHTVQIGDEEFDFHLLSSGITHPNKRILLARGMVINPRTLVSEIQKVQQRGISTNGLRISREAHLVFDYHIHLDKNQENGRGTKKIGTTKRGIGPTYEHKARRTGIRAELLKNPHRAMDQIYAVLKEISKGMQRKTLPDELKPEYYESIVYEASRSLGPLVIDSHQDIQEAISQGKRFLIEGAQGALLSIDDGTYPNVTSSNTNVSGLLVGAGIPPYLLKRSILVYKAYPTRVGNGAFPTKMNSDRGERIRKKAHEYGVTTGRPRDPGDFDGVAACYAAELNRTEKTEAVITRGDVLTGLGRFYIARQYLTPEGEISTNFETDDYRLSQTTAIYNPEEYYEWNEDFQGATHWDQIPEGYQRYVAGIQSTLPEWIHISGIGTGPRRGDMVKLSQRPKVLAGKRR